jgi:hypothetical protein
MKRIIILFMALTLTTVAQAGTLRLKFNGKLLNYTNQDSGKLQGSIFWQCSKKPLFSFGGLNDGRSCGNGNAPIKIDNQGNFSVNTKVKYGSGDNTLQLRIGPKGADYSYQLIKLPYDLKEIKKKFSTLSLYKLKAQKLNMSLVSGRNARKWLATTGKDTQTEFVYSFLDENQRTLLRVSQRNLGNNVASDLRERHIILSGDRGKHPLYKLSVEVNNWKITNHLSSSNLFRKRFKGPFRYDGQLPFGSKTIELNDKYLE